MRQNCRKNVPDWRLMNESDDDAGVVDYRDDCDYGVGVWQARRSDEGRVVKVGNLAEVVASLAFAPTKIGSGGKSAGGKQKKNRTEGRTMRNRSDYDREVVKSKFVQFWFKGLEPILGIQIDSFNSNCLLFSVNECDFLHCAYSLEVHVYQHHSSYFSAVIISPQLHETVTDESPIILK